MEAPASLLKIKQLTNKKPKPKCPTTRKRTLEELELPGDGGFEDEDEDEEEDEDKSKKCVLESAIAWPVTPSGKHDQCFAALQTMLVELFSVDAVRRAAAFASSLRENADLMASAQIRTMPTKQQDASVFKILGDAVKRLIVTEANTVLVEVGSLALFANTGELLAHHIELLRGRSELLHPLYCAAYSRSSSVYGKKDTTGSYRQYIISTTIADTYGTEAAQARPLVEQKLRIAEVVHWFKLAFGNGALALLVQSQWKKNALKAWDFRVPTVLRHLATTNSALVKVCSITETNIWSCFDNAEGVKVPRRLKYEKYSEKQIG
ncbi:hypothetical protein KCU67_g5203, partial [Aureobasidium melanogenum]